MKNREQVAWALGFSEYNDLDVAIILSDVLDAIGVYLDRDDRSRLGQWLGLDCDPETNNWGILPSEDCDVARDTLGGRPTQDMEKYGDVRVVSVEEREAEQMRLEGVYGKKV